MGFFDFKVQCAVCNKTTGLNRFQLSKNVWLCNSCRKELMKCSGIKTFLDIQNKSVDELKQMLECSTNIDITLTYNGPEKYTIAEGQPPFQLNDIQKLVLFLDWCNKTKSSIKHNTDYPQWLSYRLHISPSSYHKQAVEQGYLELCSPDIALNTYKVTELKEILQSNNLDTKGKKADLINRVLSNVDITSLNLQECYQPSNKGLELLNDKTSIELLVAFYNRYDISLDEFYYVKSIMHPDEKPNDILWSALNKKMLLNCKNKNYGLARNVCLHQAYLLEDEKRYLPAFEHYIKTAFYDLSGCDNHNSIIEKDKSLIAPAIIGYIQQLSEYYTDKIIERCERIYLPHHHYSIDEFKKIIDSIINETDYYLQFVF